MNSDSKRFSKLTPELKKQILTMVKNNKIKHSHDSVQTGYRVDVYTMDTHDENGYYFCVAISKSSIADNYILTINNQVVDFVFDEFDIKESLADLSELFNAFVSRYNETQIQPAFGRTIARRQFLAAVKKHFAKGRKK